MALEPETKKTLRKLTDILNGALGEAIECLNERNELSRDQYTKLMLRNKIHEELQKKIRFNGNNGRATESEQKATKTIGEYISSLDEDIFEFMVACKEEQLKTFIVPNLEDKSIKRLKQLYQWIKNAKFGRSNYEQENKELANFATANFTLKNLSEQQLGLQLKITPLQEILLLYQTNIFSVHQNFLTQLIVTQHYIPEENLNLNNLESLLDPSKYILENNQLKQKVVLLDGKYKKKLSAKVYIEDNAIVLKYLSFSATTSKLDIVVKIFENGDSLEHVEYDKIQFKKYKDNTFKYFIKNDEITDLIGGQDNLKSELEQTFNKTVKFYDSNEINYAGLGGVALRETINYLKQNYNQIFALKRNRK